MHSKSLPLVAAQGRGSHAPRPEFIPHGRRAIARLLRDARLAGRLFRSDTPRVYEIGAPAAVVIDLRRPACRTR